MDAFDADVLIYAASPKHKYARRIRDLLRAEDLSDEIIRIGSVLLLPELLSKPLRTGATIEVDEILALVGRLDLRPVDKTTALLATQLGATYRLRAADAVHLATAVAAGADRFITNNQKDFSRSIAEIDVTYPEHLVE
jgi:predicted nucleic acid-binding protein